MLLQVTIKDLSWEDKELVLRVLFSKINGSQSANPNNKIMSQQGGGQSRMSSGNNRPVFISEGALMPQEEYVDNEDFEITSANDEYA